MKDKLIMYSMQVAMIKQLSQQSLINEDEYFLIKARLMRDYGIISDIIN